MMMNTDFEMFDDEIVSIECIGEEETIDIETDGNHLFFANGVLTHNSAVNVDDLDHSHIAGGMSKINTADLVLGIITNNAMREKGEYMLQILKSRNSRGTGRKIPLLINTESMKIYDNADFLNSINSNINMSVSQANSTLTQTELDSTMNDIQDALNKGDPNYKTTTSTVGGSSDDRMGQLKTLINKSQRGA